MALTDRRQDYGSRIPTLVTHHGQLKKVGPKAPADLEVRLYRALEQIRDLERELGEVLDRLSALEGRPPLKAA